jgi:hypothetical protein
MLSPVVSGVSPNIGRFSGGTLVQITGANFTSGARVKFGGKPSKRVTFVSSSVIVARTPAHAVGTVTVEIINPDGQSGLLANAYTFVR